MSTSKPRYTFTDTGELQALLDAAARWWPQVGDRKALLLKLAEQGASASGADDEVPAFSEERWERVRRTLQRIPALIDVELLLSDRAWC